MSYLPATYQPSWNYGQQVYPNLQGTQMSFANQEPQVQGLTWVDGEVGAKAYQMPQGWPCNKPIALWDTNDTVIYLKSINPMGMPNPLQKAHYTLEGVQTGEKSSGFDGTAKQPDLSEYVRKEDLDKMKHELMETIDGLSISGRKAAQKGE